MRLKKSSGKVLDIRMKEGDGTTAYDSSRYRNDGALTGCKWVENGLEFNGVSDYVDCGNDASLKLTTAGTYSCYLKIESLIGTHDTILVSGNGDSYKNMFYALKLNGADIEGVLADNVDKQLINFGSYIIGKWHHALLTWSGGNVRAYLDGIEKVDTAQTRIPASNSTGTMFGKSISNIYRFKGSISNPQIYNRALSAAEIKRAYKQDVHRYV